MRIRTLAFPLAVAGVLVAVGTAVAWPANSITVETNGCTYTIQVNDDQPGAFVGWEVRVWNASPLAGELVASGSGTEDSQGHLTIGPFTAAQGHYNALVDYHLPVTESAEVVEFTLTCSAAPIASAPAAPSASAPAAPIESAPAAPSESVAASPTGNELPVAGGPSTSPTGGELGLVGTPPGVTPPPTDTAMTTPTPSNDGWALVLVMLAGLIAGAALVTRIPASVVVRKRDR